MRPRVIVNAAMSVDGKIALRDGQRARLSNEDDVQRVHGLRGRVDAELAADRSPLRIVLDSDGRTPASARVLDGRAPTLIVTSEACDRTFAHADVLRCGKEQVDRGALLDRLGDRGIRTLLVEGGSTVIWSFLRAGLVDELKVFVGSLVLGGRSAPTLVGGGGAASLSESIRLALERSDRLGDGVLLEYSVVR